MSDSVALSMLDRGVEEWNSWRKENSDVRPDLSGANLADRNLEKANLSEVRLCGADLSRAGLMSAHLCFSDLRGAKLIDADVEFACLRHADLRNARMDRATFDSSDLKGADLDFSSIVGGNLSGAILYAASLGGADLRSVEFTNTVLDAVSFVDGDFERVADVEGAKFRCNLAMDGVSFFSFLCCKGLEKAAFESGFSFPATSKQEFLAYCPEDIRKAIETEASNRVELALRNLVDAVRPIELPEVEPPSKLIDFGLALTERIRSLSEDPKLMYRLRPREFEEVVAEILTRFGWKVDLTGQTRDGGYDIFGLAPSRDGVETSWVVECKRYSPERVVGINIVRELYGVKPVLKGGANILIATTSRFSREVERFQKSRYDLSLKDYAHLVDWLRKCAEKA